MFAGWHSGTGHNRDEYNYRRPMSNGWGQMSPYGYNQGMNGYSNNDYYGYGNNRDYYGYGQG
eukprot:4934195-Ditylum_brightwellii.AAC.1